MLDSQPRFPVARPAAGVRQGYDLNFIEPAFTINQEKWKPAEQISARIELTRCPAMRSFEDLRNRVLDLLVEPAGRIGIVFEIPVE